MKLLIQYSKAQKIVFLEQIKSLRTFSAIIKTVKQNKLIT
jgi:hypothetical protein